ncbi:MAG: hypothetical protein AB7K73_11455 [Gammaproteobacteria bacterium]
MRSAVFTAPDEAIGPTVSFFKKSNTGHTGPVKKRDRLPSKLNWPLKTDD